jgi:hypothetical protein
MVAGKINLTCDRWRANNTDGYFAVTGHWVEELIPTQWGIKSGLLSFTRLNNAHNGEWLAHALLKVIKRVGVEHKVSRLSYCMTPLSSVLTDWPCHL